MARKGGNPLIGITPKVPRQGENCALGDALFNDIDAPKPRVREQPKDRRVVELAGEGYTYREIAAAMELSPKTVSNTLRQPWAREYMIKRMKQSANEEIKKMLEDAAPRSIERVISLAQDAQGSELGFKADKEILDRFLGRAVQPIANEPKDFEKLSDKELETIARGSS